MTATQNKSFQGSSPSLSPDIRLKDIIKTLPPSCFEKNQYKAWRAVLISITSVILGYWMIGNAPWFLLPFAWFFTGTALTGWFVIGHDCGHRSFSNRRWVNDLVGHFFFLPLIYPFHSWRLLHNHHHRHTNKLGIDNAWQPWQTQEYDQSGRFLQAVYQGLRGRLWWTASILHWAALHFNPNNRNISKVGDRNKVQLSVAVVVIFSLIFFPTLLFYTGVWGVVKFWLMPWLVYHFWMSTFTLVHHSAPTIQFSPTENWNEAQAQLLGTVHCSYPSWVEFLCHDINVHIPHHISVAIPSYNLSEAHRSLMDNWGAYLNTSKFSWRMMQQIIDYCHLYHPTQAYQSFNHYRFVSNK